MINKKFNFIMENCNNNYVVVINFEVMETLFAIDKKNAFVNDKEKELYDAFNDGIDKFIKDYPDKTYTYILIYRDVEKKYHCLYCQEYSTENFQLVKKIVNKKEKIKIYKINS